MLLAAVVSCTSDETTDARPEPELIKVDREVVVPASETGWTVNITADCHWEVSAIDNNDWDGLTISPRSGDGNGVLVLSTETNRYSVERSATVTLRTKGGLQQVVNLRQSRSDAAISINQEEFSFTDTEGLQNLIVSSNTNWQIHGASNLDWLELGQTLGNAGVSEIAIKVKDAADDALRSATLTVSAGGSNSVSFRVMQQGKSSISLSVSPSALAQFPAEGGTQTIAVSCNARWYAYVSPDAQGWLHIEPATGYGDTDVSVTCDSYSGNDRDRSAAFIIVSGTREPKQSDMVVSQKAAGVPIVTPGEDDNPNPQLSRKK